jgi:hypothetical protein
LIGLRVREVLNKGDLLETIGGVFKLPLRSIGLKWLVWEVYLVILNRVFFFMNKFKVCMIIDIVVVEIIGMVSEKLYKVKIFMLCMISEYL